METGTLNERIQIYEPKAERNLTSLDDYELSGTVWANVRAVTTRDQMRSGIDVHLIRWNDKFYGIDNLSADKHKGEILLGCSYSGLNDNQRITT